MAAQAIKLLLSWGVVLGPQVYDLAIKALGDYQAQHPNPYLTLLVSALGAGILQLHQPKK